ncbi:MAG TPA: BlaI/MecI/CopY family transcriptional regulator [Verrucomicrobiae bacterium]
MKPVKISDSEWQVMNLLWERSPLSGGEIISALQAKSAWRPRTIRTLLDRLIEKGAIKVLSEGKRRFAPQVSQEACIHSESHSFIKRVFGGRPASMLLQMIKETNLTDQEIDQLKKLLAEKQK